MIERRIVSSLVTLGERWAGIPAVEVTTQGRVYVAFFSGGDTEPASENTIYLTWSDDHGMTFRPPFVIASPEGGARAFDPALWIDPVGRLWLLLNRSHPETATHGVHAIVCVAPDEAVPEWRPEFPIPLHVPFCFRLNKPTVLTTGEWLLPVTHSPDRVAGWFPTSAQLQGVAISVDGGTSWTLHGAVESPAWALENMVVERRTGSLSMYIRAGSGVIWTSSSDDRGRRWSPASPTTIGNPGSRFFIRRLPDGRWLLINSPDPTKRTGIVASLSDDEGATWHGRLVLDDRDNVSYPDATITADGIVHVVHDHDRKRVGETVLTRFELDDIV